MLKAGDRVCTKLMGFREFGKVDEISNFGPYPIRVEHADGKFGAYLVNEVKEVRKRKWRTQ